MKFIRNNLGSFFFLLVIVGIFVSLSLKMLPTFPFLKLQTLAEARINELLWGALFITLIVERTLEVFVSAWREPGKLIIERLASQEKLIEKSKTDIQELERKRQEATEESRKVKLDQDIVKKETLIENLTQEIANTEKIHAKDIEHYKMTTKSLALYGGFLLGLFSSLVGVRILEPLVDTSRTVDSSQLHAFRGLDILLTALAISGGSQIFHLLVSVLTDFGKQTRTQINQPPIQ